jgi:tRNA nucleotidyltransferase (CCA-adding enzyme)
MLFSNMDKLKEVLQKQLKEIVPYDSEIDLLKIKLKQVLDVLNKNIKSKKIKAKVFLGGSYAKNTLIKKKRYDVDIFIRFNKNYSESDLNNLLKKIVPKDSKLLHGSRNYYNYTINNFDFEIIPVIEIKKPIEARNVTDLSYFHVNYIKDKIKKKPKIADEIRLSKAFTYYQECYGAESYIMGFSGYALELLMTYYESFSKFIKVVAKLDLNKNNKIIIDPAKFFKNSNEILKTINKAKSQSPIVFIDPTFKERNALAALSIETFKEFQKSCKKFIKSPSEKFFILKNKKQEFEKKYKKQFNIIEIFTKKQSGDIAGTKLKKFYRYFIKETSKFFNIKSNDFEYSESENKGIVYLAVQPKKQMIIQGPPIKMKKAYTAFKKQHKNKKIIIKAGKAYIIKKINPKFNDFLIEFQKHKKQIIKEMSISKIKSAD